MWKISELLAGINLYASNQEIIISNEDCSLLGVESLQGLTPFNELGTQLPMLVPQLIGMGVAEFKSGGFRMSYEDLIKIETKEDPITVFESVAAWAPFSLEIDHNNYFGSPDFSYNYRFYQGRNTVSVERKGVFVRARNRFYRLDHELYCLLQSIDDLNNSPKDERVQFEAYLKFRDINLFSESTDSTVDPYLKHQRILIPDKIELDIIAEENGRVSFCPSIPNVENEALRQTFMSMNNVDQVIHLIDSKGGGGVTLALSEPQREVLRRMQKVRHVSGEEKARFLSCPCSVFEGVAEYVDLASYGPRVQGIGDFPFVVEPYREPVGIFDGLGADATNKKKKNNNNENVGLVFTDFDGEKQCVKFDSVGQLKDFEKKCRIASENGKMVVDFFEKTIRVTPQLLSSVQNLLYDIKPDELKKPVRRGQYLLIQTNDIISEYIELVAENDVKRELPEMPKSFRGKLKPHQVEGLAWLQRNYLLGRRGCLLADDMGLGKTLQVLCFIAWLIENGELSPSTGDSELPPWDPILIAMPLILLQNEVWQNDIEKFFDPSIFSPFINLYGSELKKIKQGAGVETQLGQPMLDRNSLRKYRVIFTNYETMVNYQHSLGLVSLTLVVTDESQRHKTPNTKISHALKSLAARFRVSSTGTPVETTLNDTWNLFDFLQPGLLGSLSEFSKAYSAPTNNVCDAISQLKRRLKYETNSTGPKKTSFLLRRDKANLANLGLPSKEIHRISCVLSPEQRDKHMQCMEMLKQVGPFSVINQLIQLYQHPALVPSYTAPTPEEALKGCHKLQMLLESLKKIRSKNEKVLIFTRYINAQQLLKNVIDSFFKLNVGIVNGIGSVGGEPLRAKRSRDFLIKQFQSKEGFDVLILSPDVAGFGITITEANHVIHYGRGWNPAKESQATDRVYRIGQTRDVHVYYLIAKDPKGKFKSFDERLDEVLEDRMKMASDFLMPMPDSDQPGEELLQSLASTTHESSAPIKISDITSPYLFEALVAVLEEKGGARVFLTPKGNDGGVDIVSIAGKCVRLIDCKHYSQAVDFDQVEAILNSLNGYLPRISRFNRRPEPSLYTSNQFTRAASMRADENGVVLVGRNQISALLSEYPVMLADVMVMENRRYKSMADLRDALRVVDVGSP